METRAHYVLIGSFALSVIAGAFLFVLWLGQLGIDREFDFYDVVFNDPVTGLSIAGDVRYNGIKVGEVDDLRLNPRNPTQVIARIKVDASTPVKQDTTAQLELAGLTGVSFIQLAGGSSESALLAEASGHDVPVIEATPSEVQRILTEGGDIIDSVNTAVVRVSELLSEENAENVRLTLENVQVVTGVLARHEDEIDALIQDLSKSGEDLRSLTEDLAAAADRAEVLMNGDVAEAISEARVAIGAARGMFEEAEGILGDNREAISAFAEQGLGQTTGAMAEARRMMSAVERLATAIERDPARFFLGRSYPEYEGESE